MVLNSCCYLVLMCHVQSYITLLHALCTHTNHKNRFNEYKIIQSNIGISNSVKWFPKIGIGPFLPFLNFDA